MRRIITILALMLCFGSAAFSQTGSDIYLVPADSQTRAVITKDIVNITARPGYDNQPCFCTDGSAVFFSSIRTNSQSDIYKYVIETGSAVQVTFTPESEYSPTIMPDMLSFSTVRVEMDSVQRLWRFLISGGAPEVLFPDIREIGYHAWINPEQAAFFILGNTITLQLVDINSEEPLVAADSIGRCLQTIPGKQAISFVSKSNPGEWMICKLDGSTGSVTPIIAALAGSEDFAWTPGGSILMGSKGKLYQFTPDADTGWREIADFTGTDAANFNRIAVSPGFNYIALVADDGK